MQYKITKPVRLIELFSGYGSQYMALKRLGVDVSSYKISEWNTYSTASYNALHSTDRTDYSLGMTKDELVEALYSFSISSDGKVPMTKLAIQKKGIKWLRKTYNDFRQCNNLGSLCNFHSDALDIVDTDKYEYILSYSFPCQDLSLSGLRKGMDENSGTRSALFWEVKRLLGEIVDAKGELPQILFMENVPQVQSSKNVDNFNKWLDFLSSIGYSNFYSLCNAKDFGIPQSRNRCFMFSVLGDYSYNFPKPIPLTISLRALLEDTVDEKYYIENESTHNLIKRLELDGALPRRTNNNSPYHPCAMRGRNTDNPTSSISGLSTEQKLEFNNTGVCNTITTVQKDSLVFEQMSFILANNNELSLEASNTYQYKYRLRKLTPLECFRLMGLSDEDAMTILSICSDSQAYKQAGNSIVVDVMCYLFAELFVNVTYDNSSRFRNKYAVPLSLSGNTNQIGSLATKTAWANPSTYRVYDINGIAPTLNSCGGGGHTPEIIV